MIHHRLSYLSDHTLKTHRMNFRGLFELFLFISLISATKGGAKLIGPSRPVLGLVGDDVILPCSLQPAESVAEATVEWLRPDLSNSNVFIFRDGRESYQDQNPSFQQRATLFLQQLKNGNMSLKLSRLQLSDAGDYTCKWIKSGSQTSIQVRLAIGAVSEPKIYAKREGTKVALQCEANNWYPQPEMEWTDGKGNIISHDSNITKNGQYYSVHGTIEVEMTENVYTCTVRQQNIKQSRETNYTVVCQEASSQPIIWAIVFGLLFVISAVAGIVACKRGR
ncbi:butyrophilin subfamily 1 member A1 isoform X2 [Lates calcarifer]|uniref:Butyrophilin subfamily 1 member A1 isoform X2 n=1 Tax=Lates calcarifer TaxID=8187 RepID=A0AAJ7PSF7_LATCA|nr:butyrophilin subfamily 1 member A1 isoform X2 [Lates calcarifer]